MTNHLICALVKTWSRHLEDTDVIRISSMGSVTSWPPQTELGTSRYFSLAFPALEIQLWECEDDTAEQRAQRVILPGVSPFRKLGPGPQKWCFVLVPVGFPLKKKEEKIDKTIKH